MPATDRRKVSLRVAHQGHCPNKNASALTSAGRGSGCKCQPTYYTLHRDPLGRAVKGRRIGDKVLAEREQTRLQRELDEARDDTLRPSNITFDEWAETFRTSVLASRGSREKTRREYASTLNLASSVFGSSLIRSIGNPELRALQAVIEQRGGSVATLSRHLRQLSSVFEAAVGDKVISSNPVPAFKKGLKLKVPRGTTPFTDEELVAVLGKLATLQEEPTKDGRPRKRIDPAYVALVKAAATTGARRGELIHATWGDLDLSRGVLHIRYGGRDAVTGELTGTKDHEPRDVYLIPPARKVFEDWITLRGYGADDEPIFRTAAGTHVNGDHLTRLVKRAMIAAGVPLIGRDGRSRKPLHALRATFTRICLESGRAPQWVQGQLGHSSEDLTVNVYGEWSETAIAAEAARGAAFPDLSEGVSVNG